MYQKDYILRLIEEMTRVLAVILGLMKKGDFRKAAENLENTYHNLLKEDAAYFRQIPEEDLTSDLLEKHNYTNVHLEVLAELFNAEAELCLTQNDRSSCLAYSRKSLLLFRFIDTEYKTYLQERLDKIKTIEARIRNLIE